MTNEVAGSLGTRSSLGLRLGQIIFSSASLFFMCLDLNFYSYTAFWRWHSFNWEQQAQLQALWSCSSLERLQCAQRIFAPDTISRLLWLSCLRLCLSLHLSSIFGFSPDYKLELIIH
uniref:Uncharacterized protein n=1 Tax=Opuntia streptacantha TaxID=393608 RepID=A0A7C9AKQ9_OPUST